MTTASNRCHGVGRKPRELRSLAVKGFSLRIVMLSRTTRLSRALFANPGPRRRSNSVTRPCSGGPIVRYTITSTWYLPTCFISTLYSPPVLSVGGYQPQAATARFARFSAAGFWWRLECPPKARRISFRCEPYGVFLLPNIQRNVDCIAVCTIIPGTSTNCESPIARTQRTFRGCVQLLSSHTMGFIYPIWLNVRWTPDLACLLGTLRVAWFK